MSPPWCISHNADIALKHLQLVQLYFQLETGIIWLWWDLEGWRYSLAFLNFLLLNISQFHVRNFS